MFKKILYIEISTAHTEIISSFVESLISEYEVTLLINQKSIQRIKHLENKIKIIPLVEAHYLSEIIKAKKSIGPDLILLNSSQGRKIRNLTLRLFFDATPIIGIHHNAENILKSFTQKIINFKVKKYIVLADFIKEYLVSQTKIQIESFYPLIYPHKKLVDLNLENQFIAIPGVLEQDRRDYFGLIELVKQFNSELSPKIKFVLLGNSKNHDGPEILKRIQNHKIESRFIIFDEYVNDDLMISYVTHSKAIMPLLQPGTRWFDKYFETKISGAYSLAYSFNKHLLMHEVFKNKEEFKYHGIFYNELNFKKSLDEVSEIKELAKQNKFEFSFQKEKLLSFLKN